MGEQPAIDQQVAASEVERQATTVFAPRIPVTMRQDVEAIQGLTGQSVNEVGIEALTLWMEARLADEALGVQALAEIDAEQQRLDQRRAGLANILGRNAATGIESSPEEKAPAIPVGKRGKAATAGGSD